MSAKQLRKMRELAGAGGEEGEQAPDGGGGNAEGEEAEEGATQSAAPRRPGFAALLAGSSDSDAEQDSSEPAVVAAAAPSAKAAGPAPATGGEAGHAGKEGGRRRRRKPGAKSSTEPSRPAPEAEGQAEAGERRRRKASSGTKGDGEGAVAVAANDEDEDDAFLDAAVREAQAAGEDAALEGPAAGSAAPRALAMRRTDFSVESERRRVVGAGVAGLTEPAGGGGGPRGRRLAVRQRGVGEGQTAHHRRLFLVTPTADEPWPRPEDCMAMVADTDADGAAVFDFEDTSASSRSLAQLRDCLRAQDPQYLQQFLLRSVFCVDGLLTLAEYFRSQQSHEQAFQLVRRAVYALECCLHPAFSPFAETGIGPSASRPRVAIRVSDDPAWPGWSWLRAMWMYMHGLAGQGMHRTALEVCKLLLASTLPRDPAHVLPVLDYLCLRSKQYDVLARISRHLAFECGLQRGSAAGVHSNVEFAAPGVAYSLALAGYLKAGEAPALTLLNEVGIDDVIASLATAVGDGTNEDEEASAPVGAAVHAQLMRALLVFPLALRPLLEEAGASLQASAPGNSTSRERWADLMARPPFSDAAEFRHSRYASSHGRLCAAYAKRCGALWRPDLVMRWLHSCAARLVGMHDSPVFAAELAAARARWAESAVCLEEALLQDYADLLPEEGTPEAPLPPPAFDKAIQARLHPPLAPGELGGEFADGFGAPMAGAAAFAM